MDYLQIKMRFCKDKNNSIYFAIVGDSYSAYNLDLRSLTTTLVDILSKSTTAQNLIVSAVPSENVKVSDSLVSGYNLASEVDPSAKTKIVANGISYYILSDILADSSVTAIKEDIISKYKSLIYVKNKSDIIILEDSVSEYNYAMVIATSIVFALGNNSLSANVITMHTNNGSLNFSIEIASLSGQTSLVNLIMPCSLSIDFNSIVKDDIEVKTLPAFTTECEMSSITKYTCQFAVSSYATLADLGNKALSELNSKTLDELKFK